MKFRILNMGCFLVSTAFFLLVFFLKAIGQFKGFTSSIEIFLCGDKVMHVCAWFCFFYFFCLARGPILFEEIRCVKDLLLLATLPLLAEVIQHATPHSSASLGDLFASFLGCGLGTVCAVMSLLIGPVRKQYFLK